MRNYYIACLAFGVFFRLLPHVANVSPLFASAILLTTITRNYTAILFGLLSFMLSDALWAAITHNAFIGTWTVFTWSGLAISLLANRTIKTKLFTHFSMFSLLYWLWTNLGTWLASGIYTHNLLGFFSCYTNALPFLLNQYLGVIVWGYAFYCLKPFLISFSKNKITNGIFFN
jgi:hypothetical protein